MVPAAVAAAVAKNDPDALLKPQFQSFLAYLCRVLAVVLRQQQCFYFSTEIKTGKQSPKMLKIKSSRYNGCKNSYKLRI